MASGEFIGLGVIKTDHINTDESLFLNDVSVSKVEPVG